MSKELREASRERLKAYLSGDHGVHWPSAVQAILGLNDLTWTEQLIHEAEILAYRASDLKLCAEVLNQAVELDAYQNQNNSPYSRLFLLGDFCKRAFDYIPDDAKGRENEIWLLCDDWPKNMGPETHEAIWFNRAGFMHKGTHFGWRATLIRKIDDNN